MSNFIEYCEFHSIFLKIDGFPGTEPLICLPTRYIMNSDLQGGKKKMATLTYYSMIGGSLFPGADH